MSNTIRISESLYLRAVEAAAARHLSLEEYVAASVEMSLEEDHFESFFTPEMLAELDQAAAEAKAGETLSGKQVDEYLADHQAEWLAKQKG